MIVRATAKGRFNMRFRKIAAVAAMAIGILLMTACDMEAERPNEGKPSAQPTQNMHEKQRLFQDGEYAVLPSENAMYVVYNEFGEPITSFKYNEYEAWIGDLMDVYDVYSDDGVFSMDDILRRRQNGARHMIDDLIWVTRIYDDCGMTITNRDGEEIARIDIEEGFKERLAYGAIVRYGENYAAFFADFAGRALGDMIIIDKLGNRLGTVDTDKLDGAICGSFGTMLVLLTDVYDYGAPFFLVNDEQQIVYNNAHIIFNSAYSPEDELGIMIYDVDCIVDEDGNVIDKAGNTLGNYADQPGFGGDCYTHLMQDGFVEGVCYEYDGWKSNGTCYNYAIGTAVCGNDGENTYVAAADGAVYTIPNINLKEVYNFNGELLYGYDDASDTSVIIKYDTCEVIWSGSFSAQLSKYCAIVNLESGGYVVIDNDGNQRYSTAAAENAVRCSGVGPYLTVKRGPYIGITDLDGNWLVKTIDPYLASNEKKLWL